MRLIDAEILRDRLYKTRNAALADGRNKAYGKGIRDAIEILEAQPTVEPELLEEQEAKNGYWINPTSQDCHCSECGEQPDHEPGESVPLYDFCPYCGAKMEVKWE